MAEPDRGEEEARYAVLVVDDEESMRHFVARALRKRGLRVTAVERADLALEALAREPFDVLVTDLRMPGMDGHELFRRALEVSPGTKAILMTAYGTIRDAVGALKAGAETYLVKPFETDELVLAVERAAGSARLAIENRALREVLSSGTWAGLVGQSKPMRKLFRLIEQVARAEGTVLVSGPSGTGKELVARAIHARSSRGKGSFVAVHCGALPKGLVEAELFGVEPGAYTGADRSRAGYIERAAGGTLFLDEVTEIPLDVQPALLGFLEGGEVTRVGGTTTLHPDVRVVAATQRDLRTLVDAGRLRADLYFRLNVLPVPVPPLCERLDDLPLLVAHFLAAVGRPELVFPPDVIAVLQGLDYPGNVRELRNLVERLASTIASDTVSVEDLPEELRATTKKVGLGPYRAALLAFESDYFRQLLSSTDGNVSEAARLAGIPRPSLHARLSALGIDADAYRHRR